MNASTPENTQNTEQQTIRHRSGIAYREGGPLDQALTQTDETWQRAVSHRFVDELFAGTLDDTVLAGYLIQDYQFFADFLAMLGACVAHADSLEAQLRFSRQLGVLAADEDTYFRDSFAELGVKDEDTLSPQLAPVTQDFRALMREVAGAVDEAAYPRVLAVLVVAEVLYLDWATSQSSDPERAVHRGWADLHRGEDYIGWCQFLIDELDRAGQEHRDAVTQAFSRAVTLEERFFDEAYTVMAELRR